MRENNGQYKHGYLLFLFMLAGLGAGPIAVAVSHSEEFISR